MHVIATAGHVDHGKSTLVRALTGMEPDRWAEERRRGMTIDLGFAWATLPDGPTVAFVDVPGHERFVANMLAGVGPVPAVLFVVAADGGWSAQSAEHLDALDALGVGHGVLAVTRSDLADPGPAMAAARAQLAATTLAGIPGVAVSAVTGAGMAELTAALAGFAAELPAPRVDGDVRLWVDRAFTIRGAGTVVTGTLTGGTLRVGAEMLLAPTGARATIRGLQSLGRSVTDVTAVARVAVNLRAVSLEDVHRGHALLTPGRWSTTGVIDVRLRGDQAGDLPAELVLHVGSAAVPVRVRPLGPDTVRLTLDTGLPLRIGDVAVLRDPGRRRISAGVTVLDVAPPALRRRGSATERAGVLATMDGRPDGAAELARRGLVRSGEMHAMGAEAPVLPIGEWLVDPALRVRLVARLGAAVAAYDVAHPLERGAPVEVLRRELGLPDVRLVTGLVGAGLTLAEGRIRSAAARPDLPADVARAVAAVRADLDRDPYAAPDATRLADLGLGTKQLAAAVRSGALLRIADGVVLLPGAEHRAVELLGGLDQPFTLSEARQRLGTTRRVAVPLLEYLAAHGLTHRRPDNTHEVVS